MLDIYQISPATPRLIQDDKNLPDLVSVAAGPILIEPRDDLQRVITIPSDGGSRSVAYSFN